ncbi:MAG: tetratricopeptide repeat protein, partial [Desulfobacterales bacterium]|nr:tetratricopeptide repeat protein [Desulfobacterales bacterium]
KLGLKSASPDLLDLARTRTLGNPRALEALFAILSADRDTTLEEILTDAETLLPENVVNALVGEAYNRLDASTQSVMQALAVYARPVPFAAMDYLLQPYLPGVDSSPVLKLLVNMHFVRKESGRYYLHPVDQAYALSRVPRGQASDRKAETDPPLTRFALLHRAANYFKETREPRKEWKTIDDLAPQLAEIDLRCEGRDLDTAARVLLDIDYNYLLLWGHYRLLTDLHKRLQGKLDDPDLKQRSVGNLGTTYWSMGKYQEAIVCYNNALDDAREMKNRCGESAWLGNLGNCYYSLGQINRAIEHNEKALAIS